MLEAAAVTSVLMIRFVSHNSVGALWWDKCRSYCCDHQEDIGQHGCPFSIGSHGLSYYVCINGNWYQVSCLVGRRV